MTNSKNDIFYYSYFILSVILWIAYFVFTFTSPLNPESLDRFNITPFESRVIQASFALPFLGIWLAGLYGILGIRKYLRAISATPEYKGLSQINFGLSILVLALILNSVIGSLRPFFAPSTGEVFSFITNAEMVRLITIVSNYLGVIATLAAMALFLRGSWSLLKGIDGINVVKERLVFPFFTWLLSAGIYLTLFFFNPIREAADPVKYPNLRPAYFLPDHITLPTIVFPFIIAWAIGFLAAVCLEIYREKIRGVIYKKALNQFVNGFLVILLTSVAFQILATIGYQFRNINLNNLLILLYAILTMLAIGYVFIALSAKKLRKIETV